MQALTGLERTAYCSKFGVSAAVPHLLLARDLMPSCVGSESSGSCDLRSVRCLDRGFQEGHDGKYHNSDRIATDSVLNLSCFEAMLRTPPHFVEKSRPGTNADQAATYVPLRCQFPQGLELDLVRAANRFAIACHIAITSSYHNGGGFCSHI